MGSQLFIEQDYSSTTTRRNRASIPAPQVIRGRGVPLRGRKYMTYGKPSNDPPDPLGNISGMSKEALVPDTRAIPQANLLHDVRTINMNRDKVYKKMIYM